MSKSIRTRKRRKKYEVFTEEENNERWGHEPASKLSLSVYEKKFMKLEETGHTCLGFLCSVNDQSYPKKSK